MRCIPPKTTEIDASRVASFGSTKILQVPHANHHPSLPPLIHHQLARSLPQSLRNTFSPIILLEQLAHVHLPRGKVLWLAWHDRIHACADLIVAIRPVHPVDDAL